MLRKHAVLLAPEIADAPVGGSPKTELKEGFQAPRPTGWMKKLGSLNRDTQDEPVAEPIKEEEKPNGEKSAGGGSDKNGSGKKPGVEDVADAGKPKVAGGADKKPVAKAKDAKEAKGEVVLPPAEGETEAAGSAKGKEEESGEETDEFADAPAPKKNDDWEKWKAKRAAKETELRTQAKAASDRAEALAAKVAEFEKGAGTVNPEIKSRLERSEALNKQLEEVVAELDITAHPKFKNYFELKINGAHQDINEILGGEEQGKAFLQLIALPEGEYKKAQIAEFYTQLDDAQKSELGAARKELRNIQRERDDEVKKSLENKAKLQEERKEKAAALEQQWVAEVGNQLTALRDPKNGFSAFQKRAGDDEGTKRWNASVDAREEQVKEFLTGKDVSPKAVVKAAIDAASLPIYKALYERDSAAWKAREAKFEETIKTLTAAQPGGGRGEGGEKERKLSPVFEKGLSPTQRSKNWAKMVANDMNGGGQ